MTLGVSMSVIVGVVEDDGVGVEVGNTHWVQEKALKNSDSSALAVAIQRSTIGAISQRIDINNSIHVGDPVHAPIYADS